MIKKIFILVFRRIELILFTIGKIVGGIGLRVRKVKNFILVMLEGFFRYNGVVE